MTQEDFFKQLAIFAADMLEREDELMEHALDLHHVLLGFCYAARQYINNVDSGKIEKDELVYANLKYYLEESEEVMRGFQNLFL